MGTPPVFIVVCSNTSDQQARAATGSPAGERTCPTGDEPVIVPGNLPLFSNVAQGRRVANRWLDRPNTLLVDSAQLESGEAMDPAFKQDRRASRSRSSSASYVARFPRPRRRTTSATRTSCAR